MEDNMEIYFCEICSESIPAKDLVTRAALEVKGKVIGPCCLPAVQTGHGKGGLSTAGLTTAGAILLAAVAGATIFLEWRLSEGVQDLTARVQDVEANVTSRGSQRIADFEKSLDGTLRTGELTPLVQKVGSFQADLSKVEDRLRASLDTVNARLGGLEESQKTIAAGQSTIRREIQDVESEVLRLERDVASVAAAPRRVMDATAGEAVAEPDVAKPVAPAAGLPPALAHQVGRLKDADAGNRFEAVDQLVLSNNADVLEHLLPMLKDPDAFVRRLTAEGLSKFRDKTTVDALITALADPESIVRHTAHSSLKKLTGQSIAFDPDGSGSARSQAQRRWKDWWAKGRDKF